MDDGYRDYGSTVQLGGKHELSTDITYNYSPFFAKAFGCDEGVRCIYGKDLAVAEMLLKGAVKVLKSADPSSRKWKNPQKKLSSKSKAAYEKYFGKYEEPTGYWVCSIDNCIKALKQLLLLSRILRKLVKTNDSLSLSDFAFAGD